MKILIIEDDPRVAQILKRGLEENEYEVEVAYDGVIGYKITQSKKFDAIILDINLPMMNGYEVCKQIRKTDDKTPIIILTAMGTTDDKLVGFESGADDYIIKPFEFQELLARIKVFIKRNTAGTGISNSIIIEDLELNSDTKEVYRANKKIDLTAKEFCLLEYLMKNKNRVISRSELAEKIWDITFDTGTNVIDVYINYLRKKIDRDFDKKLVQTIIGMGYVIKH